ncbi:MAG: hypothetical protein IIA68_10105 [Proteobacteria bacterium]|nr:hypothetical protein [Pseudomonadota bacterium]
MTETPEHPAVTALGPKGETVRVHEYQDGDYVLGDVRDAFGLGRMETDETGHPVLVLRPDEVRPLKSLADSHSFDYEEGFIELCLDLHRFATGLKLPEIRFRSDL